MPCIICKNPESQMLPDYIILTSESDYCWNCHENCAVPRNVLIDLYEIAGCNWDKLELFYGDILTIYNRKTKKFIPIKPWLDYYAKVVKPRAAEQNRAEEEKRNQKFEKPQEFVDLTDIERSALQTDYLNEALTEQEKLDLMMTHMREYYPDPNVPPLKARITQPPLDEDELLLENPLNENKFYSIFGQWRVTRIKDTNTEKRSK